MFRLNTIAPRQSLTVAAALATFAATFATRFLKPDLKNEHFLFLAGGRQILVYREFPIRDFIDPGQLPMFYLSAAALLLSNETLLGEVVLSVALVSAVTAWSVLLATHLTRSTVLGIVAGALVFASHPWLYNYYKLVALSAGLWLIWRYVDRPTMGRLVALAAGTSAIAFMRQDLGLYVGCAALFAVAATSWRDGLRATIARGSAYVVLAGLGFAPFLLVYAASGDVVEHVEAVAAFGARAKGSAALEMPLPAFSLDLNAPLVEVAPLPPAPISVRWAPGVDDEERAELERQYGLVSPRLGDKPDGRTWGYLLLDPSERVADALGAEPRVEDTDGLGEAVRSSSWERRLPVLRLRVLPGLFKRENAEPWFYYVVVALPFVALARLASLRRYGDGHGVARPDAIKIASAAVLCVVASKFMVIPTHSRLADIGAPIAVVGAWLLGELARVRPRCPARAPTCFASPSCALMYALSLARRLTALALTVVTWASVTTVAEIGPALERSGLATILQGPGSVQAEVARVVAESGARPPIDGWAPPGSTGLRGVTRYLHVCTKPADRVLVPWFEPRVPFYAQRAFAGGVPIFPGGYFSDVETQLRILGDLQEQSVPIIVDRDNSLREDFARSRPILWAYLVQRYEAVDEWDFGGSDGHTYTILVERGRSPTGVYGPRGLPCFV